MILFCAHVCLQTAATCASLCHTCAPVQQSAVSPSSHPNFSHSVSQIQLQGSSPGDLLNKRWKIKVEAVIGVYLILQHRQISDIFSYCIIVYILKKILMFIRIGNDQRYTHAHSYRYIYGTITFKIHIRRRKKSENMDLKVVCHN